MITKKRYQQDQMIGKNYNENDDEKYDVEGGVGEVVCFDSNLMYNKLI
jgi:hypothetical protein